MASRATNLALLVALTASLASGALMFAVGTAWNRWPTLVHGVAGLAVVGLVPWKSSISRRGLRHRGLRAALPSLALALLVVAAIATGLAHRAGARELGPVLVQQLHVGSALAAVPFVVWHVAVRPVPVRRVDASRRMLLRGGLLVGGSAAATLAVPHAGRRFTRSLERGSFEPDEMPVTQWLDDTVPDGDTDAWRLAVAGRAWSVAELDELITARGGDLVATLDCTGGWYAEQRWSGIALDRLLDASGAGPGRSIDVRSSTGYSRRFPRRDAPHLLVATGVGGRRLSPGHGSPVRIVAPGRRGFWWVKWVDEIEPSDTPWWWQPPFPLT